MPLKRTDQEVLGDIGEGYVGQIVTKMGYSWLHFGGKTPGIDGHFEIVKHHAHTGLVFAVQIKSGKSYARETSGYYSVKVKKAHVKYWKLLFLPVLLVWYDRSKGKAYWTHVNSDIVSKAKTRIRISKTSKFGTHIKGDLHRLALQFYGVRSNLPLVHLEPIFRPNLREIKRAARRFYLQWRSDGCKSSELGPILITNRGWRHITAAGRSSRSIFHKLELLGAAKQILEAGRNVHVLRKLSWTTANGVQPRIFYEHRGIISYPHNHPYRRDAVVSVITERIGNDQPRFYSVYEHAISEKGRNRNALVELEAPAARAAKAH